MGAIKTPRRKINGFKATPEAFIVANLPIIKFSVDYWNTLHQPARISKLSAPSIHIYMLVPLIVMFLSFLFLFLYILILRFQAELNIRKININNIKFYKES